MKTKLLILLLLVIIATLQIQESFACSCSSHPDFLTIWMGSSGAFQGTVNDILLGNGPQKVIFDIHQVQKGNYPYGNYILEDSNIIHYGDDMVKESSCGVDYKVGETYQVFVFSGNQIMSQTNMCSTKQISGFDEYFHEDEDGQVQHYRQDYNFFSQYSLFSLIIPVSIPTVIAGIMIWRKIK